jgi:hypothetical protein
VYHRLVIVGLGARPPLTNRIGFLEFVQAVENVLRTG